MIPSSPGRALAVPFDPLFDRLLVVAVVAFAGALTTMALAQPMAFVFVDDLYWLRVFARAAGLQGAVLALLVLALWLRRRRLGRSLVLGPAVGSVAFVLAVPRFLTLVADDMGVCFPMPTRILVDHPGAPALLAIVATLAAFAWRDRPGPARTIAAGSVAVVVGVVVAGVGALPAFAFCSSIN